MKRLLIIAGIIVLLSITLAYVLIPGKLDIASAVSYNANQESVFRYLIRDNNWQNWWPGAVSRNEDGSYSYSLDDYSFSINEIKYNVIRLKATGTHSADTVRLLSIYYKTDQVGIELSTSINTGADPFSRISGYFRANKVKKILDKIVSAIQTYTGNLKNIYGGINIRSEKVQYQHLVSLKKTFPHYPSTGDIYAIISELRDYVNQQGAKELFSPMLNIRREDSAAFITQVGVPTDRDLPDKGDISSKWMMKGGNILAGEVNGGPEQIEAAMKQFEQYILDYRRAVIAIPFQMLITDRLKEPDSSKWITCIYYPVV